MQDYYIKQNVHTDNMQTSFKLTYSKQRTRAYTIDSLTNQTTSNSNNKETNNKKQNKQNKTRKRKKFPPAIAIIPGQAKNEQKKKIKSIPKRNLNSLQSLALLESSESMDFEHN